jgi:hypothetical protein
MTGPAATCPGAGRGWLAGLDCPRVSREVVAGCLAVTGGLAPVTGRIDGELRQHARAGPRAGTLTTLPGAGQFSAGDAGRDRGHHPVRQRSQAGQLGRADPDGARPGAGPSGTGTSPGRARPGCAGC